MPVAGGWQVDFRVDGSRKRMEHAGRLGHGSSAEMVPGACLDWVQVVHETLKQRRPCDDDRFHPCASLAFVAASTRTTNLLEQSTTDLS